MASGIDIIRRAFARAGIRAAESPLESDEIEDGRLLLNDMLSNWEPVYHFGFSPISEVTESVRIPRFSNMAVTDALAVILCPEYSKPVSAALAASAKLSMQMMLIAISDLSDVDMPSTLPKGTGNECHDYYDDKFFEEKDKANF